MKRRLFAFVMIIFTLVVFYFLILPQVNSNQIFVSIMTLKIPFFLISIAAVTISLIISAIRWSILMAEVHAEKSQVFINSLGIFCMGQVSGLVVPTRIGNYSKIFLIKKIDNIPYDVGLTAVNAETILDLVYIVCAGILSIFILTVIYSEKTFLSLTFLLSSLVILMGIFLFILGSYQIKMTHEVSVTNKSYLVRILGSYFVKFLDILQSTREIFNNKILTIKYAILTVFTQVFGVIGLYFVILSFHSEIPLPEVFAILTISYIIGIASLIPGGFGTSDLSLVFLLENAGIPLEVSTNIAIFWRIVMYLPIFVIIALYVFHDRISKTNR